MALTDRMWGAGKLLALIAALALTYVVFFAVAMRVALKARAGEVASLLERTMAGAMARFCPDVAVRVDVDVRTSLADADVIPIGDPAAG